MNNALGHDRAAFTNGHSRAYHVCCTQRPEAPPDPTELSRELEDAPPPATFIDANVPIYAAGGEHPYREPCIRVLAAVKDNHDAFVTRTSAGAGSANFGSVPIFSGRRCHPRISTWWNRPRPSNPLRPTSGTTGPAGAGAESSLRFARQPPPRGSLPNAECEPSPPRATGRYPWT